MPQSPDGTPQSIHGLASGSVSESFVPSSAGHVRRRLVVQSSETPVVDMLRWTQTLIQTQSILPLQTHHHHQFGTKVPWGRSPTLIL